jgi:S-adenosylmethionine hydrolase
VSSTFHGRDIFSPVAAHLANGVKFRSLGPAIALKKSPGIFTDVSGKGEFNGNIIYEDRFGNLVTNLKMKNKTGSKLKIHGVIVPLKVTYADVSQGELVAYTGSSGLVEIAARNGNARQLLKAQYGDRVVLTAK